MACECHVVELDPSTVEATLERLIGECGGDPEHTIPLLQAVQREFGYLPRQVLEQIPERTAIDAARVTGVSTFYSHFRHQPKGEHTIRVCIGTACHVKGAPRVIEALRRHLSIAEGDDTDPTRQFTVEGVACLGCCTLAPVMLIDDVTYGHMSPDGVREAVEDFLAHEARRAEQKATTSASVHEGEPPAGEIRIGQGSCCLAAGALALRQALDAAVDACDSHVTVKRVGCVGMCHNTPLLEVELPGQEPVMYAKVNPEDAVRIVTRHFPPRQAGRRWMGRARDALDRLLTDDAWPTVARYALDVRDGPVSAFLGPQKHIALEACGRLDPTDVDAYLALGGFEAARHCLGERTPDDVIAEVESCGLRGRGGAGFPTGRKWRLVRDAVGERKMIVMNGDEGDPGAFMDRMLLESYPYRVLEGMILAAYAVGAQEGVLYIREEYPLAVRRMREAIEVAENRGFLGDGVLGSAMSLRLRIMEGAGAFVCGEETALLASIEGGRGTPRLRPPYPAESGLWQRPTLVNNVETFASIPWILGHGSDAYGRFGTDTSKGTKVFALAGKIQRGGLIEVPMGVTLREVVMDIGGGVAPGRVFKAVQIGGPSGGCVPAALADTPVDFESLGAVGAIMGSGGLVVLDDRDCLVDIARYFLEFTQDQSCGRCTFCRVGTRRLLEMLEAFCEGRAKEGDIERLVELAESVQRSSLCGLGQTAPNPVLSTVRHFRQEYEAHLAGRCPAGQCPALIHYRVKDNCIGCTRCFQVCPVDAVRSVSLQRHEIDDERCTRCDMCRSACPRGAIEVVS